MPESKDPKRREELREWNRQRMLGNTFNNGRKYSGEQKAQISLRVAGSGNPMYGKKHSETMRAMAKIRMTGKRGSLSNRWKGGSDRWFREEVLNRDGLVCAKCGITHSNRGFFDVDHIVPRSVRHDGRNKLDNGMVLCPNCHRTKTLSEVGGIIRQKSMERKIAKQVPITPQA